MAENTQAYKRLSHIHPNMQAKKLAPEKKAAKTRTPIYRKRERIQERKQKKQISSKKFMIIFDILILKSRQPPLQGRNSPLTIIS